MRENNEVKKNFKDNTEENVKEDLKESFFIKDGEFYKTLGILVVTIAFQNLIAYSVNMLDNIMLGSYSQNALSGAATVNQIFFLVQQVAFSIGNALVVLASQYWGKKETQPVRTITWIAVGYTVVAAFLILVCCAVFPEQILKLFTTSPELIEEGMQYLDLLKWSFLLFLFSNLLISMLRSVEIVRIALIVSIISLLLNGGVNYILIFGRFGFPEMGIRGAAVGTVIARSIEFLIVFFYVWKVDKQVNLFGSLWKSTSGQKKSERHWKILGRDYRGVFVPMFISCMLWAISVPMQTAILGHLSDDAIAANSVSSTFFQYLKVVVVAIASASSVVIGKEIGKGNQRNVRAAGRSISALSFATGIILAVFLFLLKTPLLSMYRLNSEAYILAEHLMIIMSFVMVGMSYQMPVSVGILQGSGDTKFCMWLNLISTWIIVMPLSFLAAFVWKLPVEWVVLVIQSDQFFKGIPLFFRFRTYRWIHELTN